MKWVTWQNVGVDRMGCAWLIRRLICRGIRRTSKDDHEALERGSLVYEALYAELAAVDTQ